MDDIVTFGAPVTIEKPLTKLWCCVRCGTLYELPPDAKPSRGWDGAVLCSDCSPEPVVET